MLSRGQFLGGVAGLLAGHRHRAAGAPARYRVGHSVLGRPIHAYRLGHANATSRYLVLGCMHGDEPAGNAVVTRELLGRTAPHGVQLWLVPTMNPDGLAAGRRTNAHGVDLNRNFRGTDWFLQGRGTQYYSGPSPASEPETRAMSGFLDDLGPHTVVSMHQPLACVDFSGGSREVTLWLADHLGLPAKTLGASGGNLTAWFNDRYPRRTAVTLELPRPTDRQLRSHVADVLVRHSAHRASG